MHSEQKYFAKVCSFNADMLSHAFAPYSSVKPPRPSHCHAANPSYRAVPWCLQPSWQWSGFMWKAGFYLQAFIYTKAICLPWAFPRKHGTKMQSILAKELSMTLENCTAVLYRTVNSTPLHLECRANQLTEGAYSHFHANSVNAM